MKIISDKNNNIKSGVSIIKSTSSSTSSSDDYYDDSDDVSNYKTSYIYPSYMCVSKTMMNGDGYTKYHPTNIFKSPQGYNN